LISLTTCFLRLGARDEHGERDEEVRMVRTGVTSSFMAFLCGRL
jgi:hypothetical protein